MTVSIGGLFLAGVIPGMLVALSQMITVYVYAKIYDYPIYSRSSIKEAVIAILQATLPMMTPMIIVGGIVGGVVGNQIGNGRGRDVATVAGTLLGASIGHDLSNRRTHYRTVTSRHCEVVERYAEEEHLVGYRVEYRYKGRTFVTRTDEHPGKWIRVEVDVEPVGRL